MPSFMQSIPAPWLIILGVCAFFVILSLVLASRDEKRDARRPALAARRHSATSLIDDGKYNYAVRELRELLPELEDDVLESYEEHHVADVLVMELAAMKPDAERFTAKTTVLMENVRHHIDEEEQDWFPKVRAGLSRKTLQGIGAEMATARKKAPKGPAQPSAVKKTIDAVIS